ncbi:metallophosphoesterase family protein [Brevundimonas diminuta]|uniref:metallophosphoesterase family protein n=1 Tax=Brevundimonas diminuta TaxID=293 RepID=UPI0035DEB263
MTRAQTHRLDHLKVAVHGQSFSTPAVTDNLVMAYPDRLEHHFNIGMLHTALAGRSGHAPYAPCSLDDLKAKHYDYWALGHVHEFERVCDAPHVIFPGNIQGRTIRETGPKGAVLVSVRDGAVEAVDRVALDVLRWAAVAVDCTDASAQTAADQIQAALASTWQSQAQSLPLIVRLTLVGQTEDAGALLDGASGLRDVARALAAAISPDLYIEKVRVQVQAKPGSTEDLVSEDFTGALAEAASAAELAALLAEDLQPFLLAAQTGLDAPDDTDLRRAAADGDWSVILDAAALALKSRLLRAA